MENLTKAQYSSSNQGCYFDLDNLLEWSSNCSIKANIFINEVLQSKFLVQELYKWYPISCNLLIV